jgi:hypothetical protein
MKLDPGTKSEEEVKDESAAGEDTGAGASEEGAEASEKTEGEGQE